MASDHSKQPALHRNQSVSEPNSATKRGLRRTKSFTSSENSPHISFQQQEAHPPLRFYVDDAIHELFSQKQKCGRSKGGPFSLVAGLFACWNPSKKGNNAQVRSLSASKRVAELLEISKRQQSELADKQDTIDMLEWQLEQMQALALMENDREPARRSTASGNGLAVLQERDNGDHNLKDFEPNVEEKESTEHALMPKIEEKENPEHALKPKLGEEEGSDHALKPKLEENALKDCKLKLEEKENKQAPINEGGNIGTPFGELSKQIQSKSAENADLEGTKATLLLFEMATMRSRFSIRSFSKALIKQMEASGYSVLRTLSELEPNVTFTKKEHVVYTLESRINRAFFHCFENDSFDDSGLMQILDPAARCAARLEEFQKMKLIEVDDAVNANHPSFNAEFRRFCQRKTKELWSQFSWHIVFNTTEEREVFTAAFLDAAKSVWLLHRLAFSLNPHVVILRVGKGLEIDPLYVEAVPNLGGPEGACTTCSKSKVEFLIMPGFQAMGKIVKCQVYQHVQCTVD